MRGLERGAAVSGPEGESSPGAGLGFAMRLGSEMVSAVLVGLGLGYLLDQWLGTGPWCMVASLFFGVAAGFLNVYRAVNPDANNIRPGSQSPP
ncbi:MAG: AtpZ/AtpI family protein [Magnetococcales bacterium]|nr:AtpZ/AtpI family protein [Magnetococcales bacterium]